jgi:hypothetical protein
VRLEGLDQMRNPITSSGMEPATLRLVAQCLNQLLYPRDPNYLIMPLVTKINVYGVE